MKNSIFAFGIVTLGLGIGFAAILITPIIGSVIFLGSIGGAMYLLKIMLDTDFDEVTENRPSEIPNEYKYGINTNTTDRSSEGEDNPS